MEEFICFICNRKQSFAPENINGGITEIEANYIGWRKVENKEKWLCPMCSGNKEKLREVFNNY